MKSRYTTFLLGLCLLVASNCLLDAQTAPRPNIIFILIDDYGIDNVGAYGSDQVQTPTLDQLATNGLRSTRAYCTPLCWPTRWQLLTGQYGTRQGAGAVPYEELPFLPDLMRENGYKVGAFGKAMEGPESSYDDLLRTGNGRPYWVTSTSYNGQTITFDEPVYSQDLIREYALNFIERNAESPFFVYYPLNLVHIPFDPTPSSEPGATGSEIYFDMAAEIEKHLDAILAKLDELDLLENTLIIYAGDNGSYGPDLTIDGRAVDGGKASENAEGGALTPFIVSWPAGIVNPGRVVDDLVDFTDIVPTFMELIGGSLPEEHVFDGQRLVPIFKDEPYDEREWVFVEHGRSPDWYVRSRGFKLDWQGNFYDMSDAPFSQSIIPTNNLSPAAQAEYQILRDAVQHLDPNNGVRHEWLVDSSAKNVYYDWKLENWSHWTDNRSLTRNSGDASDPDDDGWPNLFEMGFKTNPREKNSRPAYTLASNGALSMTFPEVKSPHVEVIVEVTENLASDSWNSGSDYVEISLVNEMQHAEAKPGEEIPKQQFMRLRARRTAE